MTYTGTLVGTDSAAGNLQNLTVQWADTGSFAAGDLALIFWEHVSSVAAGSEVTQPTGFTLQGSQTDGTVILSVWSKVVTGSESGSITLGHAGATRHCVDLVVVRGYSGVHAVAGAADAGTDAVHTCPSATPTIADVGVLISSGERQTTGSSTATYPSGYTQAVISSVVGTSGGLCSVAYEGSAGSITGTHTSGVAISPGDITHDVSATDVATLTVLLTPSAFSATATLSATETISAAGAVGKATSSSIAATDAITTAGAVGKQAGASVAATGTITAAGSVSAGGGLSTGASLAATDAITTAGAVGKQTGASLAATDAITTAGTVGKVTGASLATTDTITAAGQVGESAGASLAATATVTAGGTLGANLAAGATLSASGILTATGVIGVTQLYFTPPTINRSTGDNFWGRYSIPVGQSVIRVNGSFQTIPYPWMGELIGTEGTDWFLGGRTYPITAATAAELTAAGYTTT